MYSAGVVLQGRLIALHICNSWCFNLDGIATEAKHILLFVARR